jgi:hypothetical protein
MAAAVVLVRPCTHRLKAHSKRPSPPPPAPAAAWLVGVHGQQKTVVCNQSALGAVGQLLQCSQGSNITGS